MKVFSNKKKLNTGTTLRDALNTSLVSNTFVHFILHYILGKSNGIKVNLKSINTKQSYQNLLISYVQVEISIFIHKKYSCILFGRFNWSNLTTKECDVNKKYYTECDDDGLTTVTNSSNCLCVLENRHTYLKMHINTSLFSNKVLCSEQ